MKSLKKTTQSSTHCPKRAMLTSALVLITLMPLQVSPSGVAMLPLNKPLAVAAFIDGAQILGLPKFRLLDRLAKYREDFGGDSTLVETGK